MPEPSSPHALHQEVPIGDSFDLLLTQKPILLASAVLFGLLGVMYTNWVPPRYEVKSSILLPGTKSGSSLASVAQTLGVSAPSGGDTTLPMFRKILESETVTRAVSERCGIPKKTVRLMRTIEEDAKASSIDLMVQNVDKALALRVANEYIAQLAKANTKLSLPGKSRKAVLLGTSLNEKSRALVKAEERLQAFVGTAITSPGMPAESSGGKGSADAGVAPMFRYHNQLTSLSLELQNLNNRLKLIDAKTLEASEVRPADYPPVKAWSDKLNDLAARLSHARATYRPDSPELREAQSQYDEVQRLMQQDIAKYLGAVESRVSGNAAELDLDRGTITRQIASIRRLAEAAPREALEYQRLVRDVSTLSSLISQLRIQYEQAKLESADDPNRWEVLDPPTASEEPVNKKYTRNVSLAALGGVFFAIPFALKLARRKVRLTSAKSIDQPVGGA